MPLIPRQDYMTGEVTHREYYGQFVNTYIKATVLSRLSKDRLKEAQKVDQNFNSISLSVWDSFSTIDKWRGRFKEVGDSASLSGLVCIYKEAAKQICEE